MPNEAYDAFQATIANMTNAAKKLGYQQADYEALMNPERELIVSIPVRMDDGSVKVFKGYRIQHSSSRGPCKGGVRYHQDVDLNEVRALACWMSLKCAVANIPYGGAKGGVTVNPGKLSRSELERLTRRYTAMIMPIIGPNQDIPAPDVNTNGEIMGWIMDTYSMMKGYAIPGVVTGKPLELGGSLGRPEATGRGVMIITDLTIQKLGMRKDDIRIAIQGAGNVGLTAARLLAAEGYSIVGLSDVSGGLYNPEGLDIPGIADYVKQKKLLIGYSLEDENNKNTRRFGSTDVLTCDCDLLIPAAMENQITAANAKDVRAKVIVEAANGPVTSEADILLNAKNIPIMPDILSNAGGVVVSYFEWVQNTERLSWTEDDVNNKLSEIMTRAFHDVVSMKEKHNDTYRNGALMLAMDRLISCKKIRGIFP